MGWPRCQLMCILGLYIYVCGENHIGYICELFSTAVDACEETEVASTVCAECLTGRRRRLLGWIVGWSSNLASPTFSAVSSRKPAP